jgi:hypothetical protein
VTARTSRRSTLSAAWRRSVEQRRQLRISEMQRRLGRGPVRNRTRRDYLRAARWWVLEASRGYPSSAGSSRSATNMRWAAELVATSGPGTWLELISRAGVANPEAGGRP